jgi:hypothetical protein
MDPVSSDPIMRTAKPRDSEAIASLMHHGVSAQVRRITIMGSPHFACFMADTLAADWGDEYVVGAVWERMVCMCSYRHGDTSLRLNHLYLGSGYSRTGVGYRAGHRRTAQDSVRA